MLKNFLYLAAFSTFAVIVYVAVTVYHELKVSPLKPQTQENIIPISPNFDKETLNKLKDRKKIQVNLNLKSVVFSGDGRKANNSESSSPTLTPQNASTSANLEQPIIQ